MLRFLTRLMLALFIAAPLAALVALALAFQREPAVTGVRALTPALIGRAQALVRQHNPRTARGGQLRSVQIAGTDLDLMASYAASRIGAAVRIVVQEHQTVLRASIPLRGPVRGYLNITAVARETPALPRLTNVAVGRLPIPDRLANWVVPFALRRMSRADGGQLIVDMVRSVSMRQGQLRVDYEWRDDAPERIRALAVADEDAARLRAYFDHISRTMTALPPSRRSLVDLLGPVMQLARERSDSAAAAAAENRAAIIAVAFYVNGRRLSTLAPGAPRWPRATRRTLLLHGRNDLTLHFAVSAALAAAAGTPLSDAVGLYKEIDDARGGSGFSFSDLAADRAGTTFGRLATESPGELQARAVDGLTEADLLPEVTGLVDNLPEAEFMRRFGGVDAPAYTLVVQEIERRIAASRLYQ